MAKRCLVIGANGFVGSYIVDALIDAGFMVRAFDRFSRNPQFKPSQNIELFKGDFFEDMAISRALENIDYVFHAFSATTPSTSDADPYRDISLNVLRNIQLFEKCSEANVKKVVYISSGGAVYGTTAEDKVVTEDDAPNPVSPYGIGKLSSEHYLEYFNRKYGLKHISYRLSNPYGARQITKNNQGVIPTFIEKIKNNEELPVMGDGSGSRDYIYMKDAAEIIVSTFNKDTKYTVFNLGSGVQTSLKEIIDVLGSTMMLEPRVLHLEAPKTFVQKSQISIDRLTSEFNIYPKTSFSEGIKQLLQNE